MAKREFAADVLWRKIDAADVKSSSGKEMLRGLYFNLKKVKTAENEAVITQMQSRIQRKLKLNLEV